MEKIQKLFGERSCGRTIETDRQILKMCLEEATKSKCLSRHVGAILVKNGIIIGRGANNAPVHTKPCSECIRHKNNIKSGKSLDICKAIHAEENAILDAMTKTRDLEGATLYVSVFPCYNCAKLIVNQGISKVVYLTDYDSELTKQLFDEANVRLLHII